MLFEAPMHYDSGLCGSIFKRSPANEERDLLSNPAVSVCYTYTTTYLTTAPNSSTGPGSIGSPTPNARGSTTAPLSATQPLTTAPTPVVTNTAPPPPPPSGIEFIILSVSALPASPQATPVAGVVKRQDDTPLAVGTGFVSAGEVTNACGSASIFELYNGVLTRLNTLTPVSVDPGVPIVPFNTATGSITNTFSIVNNTLVWQNSQFPQGFASFCEQDSFIYVTFAAQEQSNGCTPVALTVIPADQCPNVSLTSSISGPTPVSSIATAASVSPPISSINTGASVSPPISSVNTGASVSPPISSINTGASVSPPISSVNTGASVSPPISSINTGASVSPPISSVNTGASVSPPISSINTDASVSVPISSAATATTVSPPITTEAPIDIFPGKVFSILLTQFLNNAGDQIQSFTTSPSVSYINFGLLPSGGTDFSTLTGLVPTDATIGQGITVQVTAVGANGLPHIVQLNLVVSQPSLSGSTTIPGLTSTEAVPTSPVLSSPALSSPELSSPALTTNPAISSTEAVPSSPALSPPALSSPPLSPPIVSSFATSTLASSTSTGTSGQVFATSVVVNPGEPFQINTDGLLKNPGLDVPVSFTTSPNVSWITWDPSHTFFSGLVPVDFPTGTVTITETVETPSGDLYTISVTLVIQSASSSSALPTDTNIGSLSNLPSSSSEPLTVPTRTSSSISPSSTSTSGVTLSSISLVPGQTFDIDLGGLVSGQYGSGGQVLPDSLQIDPSSAATWAGLRNINGVLQLTGTVPDDTPSETVNVSFQYQTSAGATVDVTLPLVVASSGASATSTTSTAPALTTAPAGLSTSSSTTSPGPTSSTAPINPLITSLDLVPGQSFNLDLSQVVQAEYDLTVESTSNSPDWVTVQTTPVPDELASDVVVSGVVPNDQSPGTYTINVVAAGPDGIPVNLYLELIVSASPASSSSAQVSTASIPTSGVPTPPASQTASSTASTTSAQPSETVIYLVPGQTFQIPASQLLFGLLGAEVTGAVTLTGQTWVQISATPDSTTGSLDYSISGTVPSNEPAETVVIQLTGFDASGNAITYFVDLVVQSTASSSSFISPSSTASPSPTALPVSTTQAPTDTGASSSTAASSSTSSLPTVFTVLPGQILNVDLGPYLTNPSDVAETISVSSGEFISLGSDNVLTAAPLATQTAATVTVAVTVVPENGAPYLLLFTFIVPPQSSSTLPAAIASTSSSATSSSQTSLPTTFTVSPGQTLNIDLSPYLLSPTDTVGVPEVSGDDFISLIPTDVLSVSPSLDQSPTTVIVTIPVTSATGGLYQLQFTVVVTPLPSSVASSSSSGIVATSSQVAVPTGGPSSTASSSSPSQTLPPLAISLSPGQTYFSSLIPYLDSPTDSIVSTVGVVPDWVQIGATPDEGITANPPLTVAPGTYTFGIVVSGPNGTYVLPVTIVVPAPASSSITSSLAPTPFSTAASSTSSASASPTPVFIEPANTFFTIDATSLLQNPTDEISDATTTAPGLVYDTATGIFSGAVTSIGTYGLSIIAVSSITDLPYTITAGLVITPASISSTSAPTPSSIIASSTSSASASPTPILIEPANTFFTIDITSLLQNPTDEILDATTTATGLVYNAATGTFSGAIAPTGTYSLSIIAISSVTGLPYTITAGLVITPASASSTSAPQAIIPTSSSTAASSSSSASASSTPVFVEPANTVFSIEATSLLQDPDDEIVGGTSTAAGIVYNPTTRTFFGPVAITGTYSVSITAISSITGQEYTITASLVITPASTSSISAPQSTAASSSSIASASPTPVFVEPVNTYFSIDATSLLQNPDDEIVGGTSTAAGVVYDPTTEAFLGPADTIGTYSLSLTAISITTGQQYTVNAGLSVVLAVSSTAPVQLPTSSSTPLSSASSTATPAPSTIIAGLAYDISLSNYLGTGDEVVGITATTSGATYISLGPLDDLAGTAPADAQVGPQTVTVLVLRPDGSTYTVTIPFNVVAPTQSSTASPALATSTAGGVPSTQRLTSSPALATSTRSRVATSTRHSSSSTASTAATSVPQALNCSTLGFLAQGTNFYEVDLDQGVPLVLNILTYYLDDIDAIGYNVYDNFVYGLAQTGIGAGNLIRIGQSGVSQSIISGLTPSILSGAFTIFGAGDVDANGQYWACTTLTGTNAQYFFSIDLVPGSATYGQVIHSGRATLPYPIFDWVYIPGGGQYLYSLGQVPPTLQYILGSTVLLRFSTTTFTWTTVKTYTFGITTLIGTNTWGALYTSSTGNLYALEATSGSTYQFPVLTTSTTATLFSQFLPQTLLIDGARCADSPDPVPFFN
ncbi:hypothetical protein N0V93_004707 [Gnomoniopsis smithogilvyi]|uniref:DUF7908 domain-containing protein n=1 Tax=Gnomoniopsis smithogilvyi TaxID=1191159 RepID=A0A9W8YV70_9PEZI|nr:hypothetical protein N0V93_004707 [Gnomoniopsis smithogilvyi]